MMIHKIRLQLVVKRLDTQIKEPTNQNSHVSKVGKSIEKENVVIKLLGTSVINRPMSPPSLDFCLLEKNTTQHKCKKVLNQAVSNYLT